MKILLIFGTLLYHHHLIQSSVYGFGGTEDRFIKKYAMMKIYESCFGPDVVRQIRKEMKAACAKCASLEIPLPPATTTSAPAPTEPPSASSLLNNNNQPESPSPVANSVYGNGNPSGFDLEKLSQAIMAYRPQNPAGFRPGSYSAQGMPGGNFYTPMAFSNPNPSQQPGYPSYFYPGYQQIPFSPYGNFPLIGQQFYPGAGSRMSRDMDMRSQFDVISSKMSGKIRNVTCVMQELGYLDENLEPNYSKISQRIGSLSVDDELKQDMQDGVSFCQQFSQCVPEVKKEKSPLSKELIRPMFFFKCYKHKKLEACIMKDVREKYAGVADDFDGSVVEARGRQAKSGKLGDDQEIDDLASSMYEFLYASDSGFDIDGIL